MFKKIIITMESIQSIVRIFLDQANKNKHKIAVISENNYITYAELSNRSTNFAKHLQSENIGENTMVGIVMRPSIEWIIGLLGILKAGATYVPIDINYPKDFMNYIIEDCRIKAIVSTNDLKQILPTSTQNIYIDNSKFSNYSELTLRNVNLLKDRLAYVMYTSGSTGKPKGVIVSHENVVSLVKNTNYLNLGVNDRILQAGSTVFDATTYEIWGALLNGVTLCIVNKSNLLNIDYFERTLLNKQITKMFITTAMFNKLIDLNSRIFNSLNSVMVGGETLSLKHINVFLDKNPETALFNVYGPTENTTFSTYFPIEKQYSSNIPIGKPITHKSAYIVDINNRPLPVGIKGELLLGGKGLSLGYLNQPELTDSKFIEVPWLENEILYKTGDNAKWLSDGNIEFLGRSDFQVKINGFRIELGEIEYHISTYKSIKESIVKCYESDSGEKTICAYYVSDNQVEISEIKEYISEKIPSYMIPSFFIKLDEMPLNINGKIDKDLLPNPEIEFEENITPPTNETQKKLVEIWNEIFDSEKIGIDTNFFDLGGNSLKIVSLMQETKNTFGLNVSLKVFYSVPTIKELALYIDSFNQAEINSDSELEDFKF